MKRDEWILRSGVKAGEYALLDGVINCYVLKVKGSAITSNNPGNVLIEVLDDEQKGKQIVVLGKRLTLKK